MVSLWFCLLGFQCEVLPFSWSDWPATHSVEYLISCGFEGESPLCPIAEAGAGQAAATNTSVALDGSLSQHPGEGVTWSWTQVDNGAPLVAIQNADTPNASFTATEEGTYLFRLDLSWRCLSDSDQVAVLVDNDVQIPTNLTAQLVVDETDIPPGHGSFVPCQVTWAPGQPERLYVVNYRGPLWIIENGVPLANPVLNVSSLFSNPRCFECGFSAVAFHPDFHQNRLFYIQYVGARLDGSGDRSSVRIAGFQMPQGTDQVLLQDGVDLLEIVKPTDEHNGGIIAFGPDGHLYIAQGDGGPQGDPNENAQNLMLLNGKMLRYQVNGLDPLTIPPDNPFVGNPDALDPIYAIGFRNPWRFSFDRANGDIYIGDNGQNQVEEVSLLPAGATPPLNFGWNTVEGDQCFNPPDGCDMTGLTAPIFPYSHAGGGCSVIGGHVYRGKALPLLLGTYLYGDWCQGLLYSLRLEEGSWVNRQMTVSGAPALQGNSLIGFGEDTRGELYICTGDSVYKITGAGSKTP